jgi:hypothetical protein
MRSLDRMRIRRGCSVITLGVAVAAATGCAGTNVQQVQVGGDVIKYSDIATYEPTPQRGGEVWLLGPESATRGSGDAVAQMPIDAQGNFAGTVPAGTWRPCLAFGDGETICTEETLELDRDGVIHLKFGFGFVAASFD